MGGREESKREKPIADVSDLTQGQKWQTARGRQTKGPNLRHTARVNLILGSIGIHRFSLANASVGCWDVARGTGNAAACRRKHLVMPRNKQPNKIVGDNQLALHTKRLDCEPQICCRRSIGLGKRSRWREALHKLAQRGFARMGRSCPASPAPSGEQVAANV